MSEKRALEHFEYFWVMKYKKGIYLDQYTRLNLILYADDLTLIAESDQNMQGGIYKL